ncbi:MAG: hypothetical protein V8Q75_06475 [Bacilli bacterium]
MEFKNQYLTYEEYKELDGNLSKMPFNLLEYRAEKEVDELTFNRFKKTTVYPIELKMCINELITKIGEYNETSNKTSESVGNYSVSYDKPLSLEKKRSFQNIIKTYLSNTKVNDIFVLYCGEDINGN